MVEKTPRFAGLKKEALLEEIIKILREEAVNEDIRQRIQKAIGPQDDTRAKRIYISGKMTELEYARSLGKPVIYQEGEENVE